ncbi:malonyl-CoA O-methyltransferase [Anoxybacillus tengchongensis]|uniref:Malonyl-[acyl-carrier protein] O-methyltransferase n=1 Tax=Anoxybacillus tengchongensis TaxID=576944 RepID=A0A7X0D8I6_9BACL|nr:malonyl-ACP O-methyltransferase BioC [Anoxybacillus tengchongensis]MBB6175608.1 malonyl-CoA O-methyltransferase [Anoxybacillus tengchongensis]
MIDKQLMQKRFSERAKTYDQFANVQKKMAHKLMMHIARPPKTILEIGCGTGYLTKLLHDAYPHAKLTAVDIAPGMIETAKQRLGATSITWRCADVEEVTFHETYDLIISNATFQWFTEPKQTIAKLVKQRNNGGQLLFSTFGNGTFHELHTSFAYALAKQHIHEPLRIGPSFPTFSEWLRMHAHARGHEQFEVEYFPSVRDFFLSLRHIGATNSTSGRYCQRPSVFKTMMNEYESRFAEHGFIRATYHCIWIDIT